MRYSALAIVGAWLAVSILSLTLPAAEPAFTWIPAEDAEQVKQDGNWREGRFRYAYAPFMATSVEKAKLEVPFEGTGIVIRLANNSLPVYGSVNKGMIAVWVDDAKAVLIEPKIEPLEFVVARDLKDGKHILHVEHRHKEDGDKGCRVEGFLVLDAPTGGLQFAIKGEDEKFLVEARAILSDGEKVIRNTLVRNWVSGRCQITGLPPGKDYTLKLSAIGWEPVSIKNVTIQANQATNLPDVFLKREPATTNTGILFPVLNQPVIRQPGESFPVRFAGEDVKVKHITVKRTVGPAVISRKLSFTESTAAEMVGERTLNVKLPKGMPPGLYDLSLTLTQDGKQGERHSPRTVHLVESFPKNPVLFTFGHLDTSSQYQGEYLERVATMANLVGPDFVLNSNAVNPGYISGALAKLDVPYVVNFGNHRFKDHEHWYGDQVGIVDFGPDFSILNFGHKWNTDLSKANALLSARKDVKCKIINAFEADVPLEFIDKHQIRMLHDAHGDGKRVMLMGSTPTQRIGKINAVSFRVVRLEDNRVVSCTYQGHETDPIPFQRDEQPPLRSVISPANDGQHAELTATITNDYLDPFPNCRVTFVVPNGDYRIVGGVLESVIDSDDGKYLVLAVRCDVPAQQSVKVKVKPHSAK